MNTFLDRILETKRSEVSTLQAEYASGRALRRSDTPRGFARSIATGDKLRLVAEVKKASPSKGLIAPNFDPAAIARTYEQGGAAAVSVLTDRTYFQGSLDDLRTVRNHVSLPVLRKDFIIDEVQVNEAYEAGADAVLLICAALTADRLQALSVYSKELGLDVLIEVHGVDELDAALKAEPSVLGVNNRDLHSFEVSLSTTELVLRHVPTDLLVISESGIHSEKDARYMADCGARGLLVGESLMRAGSVDRVHEMLADFQQPLTHASANGRAGL